MPGWFGNGGKFPLIPVTFYVAYKPRVELIVSESQFGQLKNDLENKAIVYWLVGGANFKVCNYCTYIIFFFSKRVPH